MLKRRSFLVGLLAASAVPAAYKMQNGIQRPRPDIEAAPKQSGRLKASRYDGDGVYLIERETGEKLLALVKRQPHLDDKKYGRCFFFDKQTGNHRDRWWMFDGKYIHNLIKKVDGAIA